MASAGFGSEARDDASFFALQQRRLALHSALFLASWLRTLVAPLGAESGAYVASVPKGVTKVLSREARTKALSSANHFCGDEKNEASSRASLPKPADAKSAPCKAMSKKVIDARSAHVSALSHLSLAKSDL